MKLCKPSHCLIFIKFSLIFSLNQGKILVGSKDNDVIEISEKTGNVQVVVGGHSEGEVWGLDVHPTASKFITASYDGTVRLWDLSSKVFFTLIYKFSFI